tara:strand:- start:1398 stop:2315 length:918 start_codon:yes stop_codon:yes gene_type:complete
MAKPSKEIESRTLLDFGGGDNPKWKEISKARTALKNLRAVTGKAYSTLAAEAGFAPTTVSRFMRQADNARRGYAGKAFVIKASTLSTIIETQIDAFKSSISDDDYGAVLEVLGDTGPFKPTTDSRIFELSERYFHLLDISNSIKNIPGKHQHYKRIAQRAAEKKETKLLGVVEAGVFREAFELAEEDQLTLPVPNNVYGDNLFGLQVRGDSMDRKFPEGTVLLCEPFNEEHDQLPDDKYVIASRRHFHTEQVEVTVKRLVRTASKDNYVLMPESNNPTHAPLPLEDLGDFSVSVLAIVRAAIQKI